MNGDYIKLSRGILDWDWYGNINTCHLFIHMLLKANWKDGRFEGKVIPRGSFVSSYPKLAEECNLTVNELRTALKHLISTGEITVKSQSKYSVFTVKNYCQYQEVNSQITDKSQSINSQLTTIEEKKESKNISVYARERNPDRFTEFWNAYPKKVNMLNAQGEYTYVLETTAELTEDKLICAANNYAEACKIRRTKEQYMKNPDNWLKESTWMDYLPENYQKPTVQADRKKKKNSFNNFSQRNYSNQDLEALLLNSDPGCS